MKLWKRILHEGVRRADARRRYAVDDPGMFIDRIIAAPIIYDPRPAESRIADWDRLCGAPMPFQAFWFETIAFQQDQPFAIGALVERVHDSNNEHVGVILSCIAEEKSGPTFYTIAYFDLSSNAVAGQSPSVDPTDNINFDTTAAATAYLVADTLVMLGCGNIGLSPRDSDPKVVRTATKRHGPSAHGYRYHVLTVRPPGAKAGDKREVEISGQTPLHLCRGHFSEYGPEYGKGLLFGKYAGRFYIPPHIKGDPKNGIVDKDYRIPPNNSTEAA